MGMKIPLIAAAAVLSFPAGCLAQSLQDDFLVRNTGELVALCSSRPADALYTPAQNFCQGYVVGVYRTVMAQQAALTTPLLCPPPAMPTRNEAVATFVTWAQASASRLQMSAIDGLVSFLAERLPCTGGRS